MAAPEDVSKKKERGRLIKKLKSPSEARRTRRCGVARCQHVEAAENGASESDGEDSASSNHRERRDAVGSAGGASEGGATATMRGCSDIVGMIPRAWPVYMVRALPRAFPSLKGEA